MYDNSKTRRNDDINIRNVTLRHNEDRAYGSNGSEEVIPLSRSNRLRGILMYTNHCVKKMNGRAKEDSR